MGSKLFFLAAVLAVGAASKFKATRPCMTTHENHYMFTSRESMEGISEITFTANLKVLCVSVGTYGATSAKRYKVEITNAKIDRSTPGNREASSEADNDPRRNPDLTKMFSGNFSFVRTDDGSIPATYFSREDNTDLVNSKKAIVAAFQANFKGTKVKQEADTQSLHKAEYSYSASAQDVANGIQRMRRTITSDDVEGYAHHMPKEEVGLKKVEDLEYRRGVLTHASGTTNCKLMPKVNNQPNDDVEEDILEAEIRRRRDASEPEDPDDVKSYNPNLKTNHYESKGSYTLRLVAQRRIVRKRSTTVSDSEFEHMMESTLLGFINQTHRDMEKMVELRHELGDIQEALEKLHKNPNNTEIAHGIEHLVKLESKRGPLPNYSPAIEEVLEYLTEVSDSSEVRDVKMRIHIYFFISPEGSLASQMALLDSLEKAVNDEEREAIIMYIALVSNPQPQFVARVEGLISSDVHFTDPLLLAYGAMVPTASPELQQRMVLFLTNRLPEAETNSTTLIHHILSLGNSGSPHTSTHLIDYLSHPDTEIQLMAIFAMRFIMTLPEVEKSLKQVLIHSEVSEDHLTVIAKALLYGCERAMMDNEPKTYSKDLAEPLAALSLNVNNDELHSALSSYLNAIGTEHSLDLLQFVKMAKAGRSEDTHTNITRIRRGKTWDQWNRDYDLVASYSDRRHDVSTYQNRLAYIWGKKFGGSDINVQVAAGGFAGVSNRGDYKLFGHAVAKAKCYDRSATILDFLVERRKDSSSTLSRLYTVVMGRTLNNIRYEQDASVCKNIPKNLYEGKKYTIFDFTYSVFVVVGNLNFNLKATIQFSAGLYVEFCENHGSVTAAAGLTPTLTTTVTASGDLEIAWTAKAGATLKATLNYQVLPEVSTEVCYKQSQIRVKNCLGVYHQWADNTLELYAWYAWRGWCGWWACTGSDAYRDRKRVDSLSTSWDLPGTGKKKLWKKCDRDHTC